mgnify:CR=1 FL=1
MVELMGDKTHSVPKKYEKPWLSYEQQLDRLVERGVSVKDKAAAAVFLSHVNYYRFSGYCLAFEADRHAFIKGVTFDDIVGAYKFDVGLRDLLTEALEIIEIDFRTCLAYHFGKQYGPFGHVNRSNFHDDFEHDEWLGHVREEVKRSKELFVEHFHESYIEYPDLPIWMLSETISFGTLSRMYRWMHKRDKREIAWRYGLQNANLSSILLHLGYVRNLCAHHCRIWDRVWSVKPEPPHGRMWERPTMPDNRHLFVTICLIRHLLKRCPSVDEFAREWRERVFARFSGLPSAPYALRKMGMYDEWQKHPAFA